MGLKADRHIQFDDISHFMNHTQERGVIVCYDGGGSGASLDQASNLVSTPTGGSTPTASVSGKRAAGLLLDDVVNLDLTRQHLNWHKNEIQVGGKVCVLTKGWAVTNMITGTPAAGNPAYFDANGKLTPTNPDTGSGTWPASVGRFESAKDADGYAKVTINL